ncbi:MAG: conserved membrane protein of unknown function [Promethearchaeota archaeon]|nr:MAG: conserved membrane protein of unknown function [Candidatus Lokiarchaeota archaeon]
MSFQDLTPNQYLEGIFGLIWVLFAIFIGIRIILKAKSLGRTELIAVGLSYICVSTAWWGVAIQFLVYGLFSIELTEMLYLFISNAFIPVGLLFWVYSFSEMVDPYLKKRLLVIYIPIALLWEILLMIFLFININLVGSVEGLFNSTHGPILRVFIIIAILTFVITGIFFSIRSMRIEDKEIKWKGRFLFLAWISFGVGAFLDAILTLQPLTLILIRILLITGAIEYYLGFFLPKKIKDVLIKES